MIVDRVMEFRRKFGLLIPDEPTGIPATELIQSCGYLEEEAIEFRNAMELWLIEPRPEDEEAMFDALIDLTYFAIGIAIRRGWDFEEGFRRVHEANMLKELAGTSENKRQSSTDLIKPPGWKAASLRDLVEAPITTVENVCATNGSVCADSQPSEPVIFSLPEIVKSCAGLPGLSQTG